MKEEIVIADYLGTVDESGKPIGHPLKVMKEYKKLLENDYNITIMGITPYLKVFKNNDVMCMPFSVGHSFLKHNLLRKFEQLYRSWINISFILKEASDKKVWFCNIDHFLFLYLFFYKKKHSKVIITMYTTEMPKPYHNKIMKKVLPNLGLVINSNEAFAIKNSNTLYMPDYLYDEIIYGKFKDRPKSEKVVFVGTMSRKKNIIDLVEIFNYNNIKLEIYGYFEDINYFYEVKKKCNQNIKIENRYLEYDEYLNVLSSAKYCILPYNYESYKYNTSGVMLECIFVNSIPITYYKFAKKMKIECIKYKNINELKKVNLFDINYYEIINYNKTLIKNKYNKNIYTKVLVKRIKNIGLKNHEKYKR